MSRSEPTLTAGRRSRWQRLWRLHPAVLVLAALAAIRHALLMTSATNDNFLHLTLAQQWLAGDWPVRDFYDGGFVLQYALSAASQLVAGDRLLSEAIVVGAAWAISTGLVFTVVRCMTGSAAAATLAGTLPVLAAVRGYSYPKGLVYAVAAALWWAYVRAPSAARAAWLGAWSAAAFYWRPDHGVYVPIAIALVFWAVHGFGRAWLTRCAVAAATMTAVVAPFLIYVQATTGLWHYVETGVVQGRVEHTTQGPHEWPVLRFGARMLTVAPAGEFAPRIALRWTAASAPEDRRHLLDRYGLIPVETDDLVVRVRLSDASAPRLRALVNEPIVEDTAGIDRSSGDLAAPWPRWQRWSFEHWWLRLRLLPDLDPEARTVELLVALLHALPLLLAAAAPFAGPRLPFAHGTRTLLAFAAFAFLIDLAMLRLPFPARVFDAVVLPAIIAGWLVAWLWFPLRSWSTRATGDESPVAYEPAGVAGDEPAAARGPARVPDERPHVADVSARTGGTAGRLLARMAAVALGTAAIAGMGHAGDFPRAADGVAHLLIGSSAGRASIAELTASPPLRHYVDRRARVSLRLAAYIRECVPPADRVLLLWFEPDIYYYSGRLMAQRYLVFAPAWAALPHVQAAALERVARFAPPLVLARRSALDAYARDTFPSVMAYLTENYELAATAQDGDEEYLMFTRRGRPRAQPFEPGAWPCFVQARSEWSRVGSPVDELSTGLE